MARSRLAIVLAGISLLAGLALWAGLPAIEHCFASLGPGGILVVVLIHVPLILLMGLAWWWIGKAHAGPASFIMARLVRDAVAELLPFSQVGGFAAGARLLALRGVAMHAGTSSLFADLTMEFSTKILYAITGLALLAWLRPGSSVPSYMVLTFIILGGLGLLALLCRKPISRAVTRLLCRWRVSESLRTFLVPQRLAPSGLLHVMCWALGGPEAWVTLHLMGIPVTMAEALVIDSLATSLRTFGFWMPAALGVQEAAYVLACAPFGLGASQALAFSLVRRVRDLLLGATGIGLWQSLEVKHAHRCLPDVKAATEP
jgi:putative membrane protein